MKLFNYRIISLLFVAYFSCQSKSTTETIAITETNKAVQFKNTVKVIHIFVALCDNKYQGIVPVPAKIGNGQDPDNNLYWGCAFGIRSYFKNSKEWTFLKSEKQKGKLLERIIFKHKTKDYYLVADAYDGQFIQDCTRDFLNSNAGNKKDTLTINNQTIGISGNANLLGYIGHNGLMDFSFTEDFKNSDNQTRDCIILACKSKHYFSKYIKNSKSNPLIWTTQFMAPEAYSIHDAISGYILNENAGQIHMRAAKAYSKYQKCSLKAASNLMATGF